MAEPTPTGDRDQPYEILEPLDEGGYGSVYLVQHSTYGIVVMKKLRKSIDPGANDLNNLQYEADILRTLRHPNVVTFYEGRFDSRFCEFFLEYAKHGSVDVFLDEFSVPMEWKLQIISGVAMAMFYLHARQPPIIHGDLKCNNILISDNFKAKICDFGLAKIQTISTSKSDHKFEGTLVYMAPEYLLDPKKSKTDKFDVYSFAIAAWEIFYQERAYCGQRNIQVFVETGKRPPIDDSLPDDVRLLIQDCWHQDKETRPTFDRIKDRLLEQLSSIDTDTWRIMLNDLVEQEKQHQQQTGWK